MSLSTIHIHDSYFWCLTSCFRLEPAAMLFADSLDACLS